MDHPSYPAPAPSPWSWGRSWSWSWSWTLGSLLRELVVVLVTVLMTCVALAVHNRRLQIRCRKSMSLDRRKTRRRGGGGPTGLASLSMRVLKDLGGGDLGAAVGSYFGGCPSSVSDRDADRCASWRDDGETFDGDFISSVIDRLWHHFNVAISNYIKDRLEPVLTELKFPMHFVKLDLGDVPIRTENIHVHRVDPNRNSTNNNSTNSAADSNDASAGIQIDLDVTWDGDCDVMLQASLMGNGKNPLSKSLTNAVGSSPLRLTFGVKRIKVTGRMHVLLSPLATELPVVSAVQYGFTNPPDIRLEFAGVAQSLARQFHAVRPAVLGVVQRFLAGLLVLPMRMILPINLISFDYLDTYQPPVGMIRITAEEGWGFSILKKMLINDIPDTYCRISLGGSSPPFRTSTQWDNCSPSWKDESCDFILYDMDQKIYVEVYDDDPSPIVDTGMLLGKAEITVRDLFRLRDDEAAGAATDLELSLDDNEHTGCFVKISVEMFSLSNQLHSLSSLKYEGNHHVCGLLTIIVTRAFDIPIDKDEAASYVKVEYIGECGRVRNTFVTCTLPYDLDPMYNGAFHVPLTVDMMKEEDCLDDIAAAAAVAMGSPRNKSLASSVLKTSKAIVGSAMHWKDNSKKCRGYKNDIIFTLMNGDSSNKRSHKELGSFTVTHESLMLGFNHTITDRRPIGKDGASLEFRVVLSGMQSEEEKLQYENDPLSQMTLQPTSTGSYEKRRVRVTVLKGRGFLLSKKTHVLGKTLPLGTKNDMPDIYCSVRLNSSQAKGRDVHPSGWRTSTITDDTMPKWNEEKAFIIKDPSRDSIRLDAYDEHHTKKDKYLGSAEYPLEKLLRKRLMEVELRKGSELTGSFVTLKCVQLAMNDDTDEKESDFDQSSTFDDDNDLSPSMSADDSDFEEDDFADPLPPGPIKRKKLSMDSHNAKALLPKISLPPVNMSLPPVNIKEKKEKLVTQFARSHSSFDHVIRETKNNIKNLDRRKTQRRESSEST